MYQAERIVSGISYPFHYLTCSRAERRTVSGHDAGLGGFHRNVALDLLNLLLATQVSLTNDGPVTLVLDTHETRDGKTATPETSQKAQEVAAEKQRKREENEARAKANAQKKQQRQEKGQQ